MGYVAIACFKIFFIRQKVSGQDDIDKKSHPY